MAGHEVEEEVACVLQGQGFASRPLRGAKDRGNLSFEGGGGVR